MQNQPLGIIDSGVGGLSIWQEIRALLPHESTLYIADTKNCPYGEKTVDEIYPLAKRLVAYLISRDVKLIVLACNTITVSSLERLRQDFPQIPLIGTVPVVKTAVEHTKKKKIGILSTRKTAESDYQKELIAKYAADCQVVNIGTNQLVPFVERGEAMGKEVEAVVRNVLQPFITEQVDVIALGCTHFPFLRPLMQEILGEDVLLLDSAMAIVKQVKRVLAANNTQSQEKSAEHTLFTTGDREQFKHAITQLLPNSLHKISNIQSLEI